MKEKMTTVFSKVNGLKTGQKYTLGFGLFAILTVVSFLLAMPDGYTPVFKNLTEQDRQDILVELTKMGVDYKTDETGQNISLKEKDAAWVREEMTQIGLPRNQSENYQSYMEGGLGDTQSQKEFKELNFRKGQLESELVRIYPFIESATVTLTAPPKTSLFEEEKGEGAASVTLGLRRGHKLTRKQLLGIQSMVSSGVQGVKAEEVRVIDSEKGIISGDSDEDLYSSTAYEKQLRIKENTEMKIKNEINETLATIFGFSHVKVNVMVDINFDKVERQIEEYADEGVLRSKNAQIETTLKTEGEGVVEAGTDGNGEVIGYEVNENGEIVKYEQNKENGTENYEISRTIENITENPELTNTNISIWLDKSELDKRENFDMQAFKDSIAISAGMKPDGENGFINGFVSVFSENFYQPPEIEIVEEPEATGIEKIIQDYFFVIVIGAIVLFLLVATLFILLLKKKKNNKGGNAPSPQGQQVVYQTVQAGQADGEMQEHEGFSTNDKEVNMAEGINKLGEKLDVNRKLTDEELGLETAEEKQARMVREQRQKRLDEQIQELSSEHPKETADYIKKLLSKRG